MSTVTSDAPAADTKSAEELREAAAHGLRWSAIARPATEVIQLGSVLILARLIAPAEFGRVAIALIAQEVAYLIVSGGLSAALVQRKTVSREHLQSGTALALLAGFGLALVTLVAASVIVTPVFGARTAFFVRLMAPLCLVSAMGTVPTATLQRKMAFRRLSVAEVIGTFVRAAACVGLALSGLEGEALVLGVLAGAVTSAMIMWFSAPPPLPRLYRRAARELLSYGLPASLATVSWVGFSNIDYAIIGARLGAFQTGIYFRAYTVAVEYQSKLAMVMGSVGFPVLSRASSHEELTRLYRRMVGLLTTVLFPLLVLLAISAPVAIPFFFGPHWGDAIVPVQILCLGGAATLVANAAGTVLMASGRARALLGFGLAHFTTYGLTVLLVVHWGIVAVAIDAVVVHYGVRRPRLPVDAAWLDRTPPAAPVGGRRPGGRVVPRPRRRRPAGERGADRGRCAGGDLAARDRDGGGAGVPADPEGVLPVDLADPAVGAQAGPAAGAADAPAAHPPALVAGPAPRRLSAAERPQAATAGRRC